MIVEISSHGSVLRRDHECFIIQNKEDKKEIPAEKIDAIIVSSNALISTQAINLCLERNIQLVISDIRGHPSGRLWSSTPGKATELRRKQYLSINTSIGLQISKNVVTKKINRQKRLLIDLKNNRKNPTYEILQAIPILESALKKINEIDIKSTSLTQSKATILGLEGISASYYFKAIASILPKRWTFKERSQHPARDEFNASLNYIYGIGYSSVEKIIILSGLDPNAGFYHSDSYGKPTLAFDLIELIRPLLDRTIVSLFTKRKVRESWFEKQNNGENNTIIITKDGRKSLISSFITNNEKKIELEIWNSCKEIIQKLGGCI